MPNFKIKGKLLKLKKQKLTKSLEKQLSTQIRQALRAFLRAAIPRIPVDTGESRGSLLHLGRLLNVKVPIKPRRSRQVTIRGKTYTIDNTELLKTKNKDTGAAKTIINGRLTSNLTKENLFKIGKVSFNFTYSTRIVQIHIHEDKWQAMVHGRAAYIQYITEVAPDKINIDLIDYIEEETYE